MKSYIKHISAYGLGVMFFLTAPVEHIEASEPDLEAEAAILVDAQTGKMIYQEEVDVILPPASMTKIMSEYLVHEALDEGTISWDDEVTITDEVNALSHDTALSNVFLSQDETYTVQELYEAMTIYSANAATVALAEEISGSETEFVEDMNAKAEELGLTEYNFVNSSGLNNSSMQGLHPDGTDADAENEMSARATALLTYHLLNDYPEVLDTASIEEMTFKEGTDDAVDMRNWNEMLPGMGSHGYEGMDGLKTGYTELAGNAFTGTAERDDTRFISVVMRTDSREARFEETEKLMDYGFDNFQEIEIVEAGYTPEEAEAISVTRGEEDQVAASTTEAIQTLIEEGEEEDYETSFAFADSVLNDEGELVAPLEEGEVIGQLSAEYHGEQDYDYLQSDMQNHKTVEVVLDEGVEEAGWFSLTMRSIGGFFSGIWNQATDTVRGWF
nr:D-alanyl-D-alanine carboxypeptidase family protein [Salsuginibacillus kocurii]